MPSAPPKSSMSLRELAACEDFLDGHREYATDLLSSIEKMSHFHQTDTCSKTRQGRSCSLCEIGSAAGLTGAVNKALKSYRDAENHLKTVRASLGRRATVHASPRTETLFKSDLAKTVFLCVATVGDDLRSQHAAWRARLQNEIETSSSGDSDRDIDKPEILLPTYSGPKLVGPKTHSKLAVAPAGSVLGTSSGSSKFLVFRRCLTSDCPCGANTASNAILRGVHESQHVANVPVSPLNIKKTPVSKVVTTLEATARGTSVNARTDVHMPDDTPGLQLPNVSAREHRDDLSNSTSETTLTPDIIEPSSSKCDVSTTGIVDPRVSRIREQIAQSDEARRALMDWCRAWMADLGRRPQEETLGSGIGSEASSLAKESVVGRDGRALTLAPGVDSDRSISVVMTGSGREVATQGRSCDDDDMKVHKVDIRFRSKQELKEHWLMA